MDRPIFKGEVIVDPVLGLASNAALEAKDVDGWTSLRYAERRGHILIFPAAQAAGADIEAANNWEITALHRATIGRHTKLSGYLTKTSPLKGIKKEAIGMANSRRGRMMCW